jgi:hypothetical protein
LVRSEFIVVRNPKRSVKRAVSYGGARHEVLGTWTVSQLNRALAVSNQQVMDSRAQEAPVDYAEMDPRDRHLKPIYTIDDFEAEFTAMGLVETVDTGNSSKHRKYAAGSVMGDDILVSCIWGGPFPQAPNIYAYNGPTGGYCGIYIGKSAQQIDFTAPLSKQYNLQPLCIEGWSSAQVPMPVPMSGNAHLAQVLRALIGADGAITPDRIEEKVGQFSLCDLVWITAKSAADAGPLEFARSQLDGDDRRGEQGYCDSAYYDIVTRKNTLSDKIEYVVDMHLGQFVGVGQVMYDRSRLYTSHEQAKKAMSSHSELSSMPHYLELAMTMYTVL